MESIDMPLPYLSETPFHSMQKVFVGSAYVISRAAVRGGLDYAVAMSLAEYYLRRIFKEHTNRTIIEYVTVMKIEDAKVLLLETKLSITQISVRLSFTSSKYFARVFKKETGMTPSQFRKEGA